MFLFSGTPCGHYMRINKNHFIIYLQSRQKKLTYFAKLAVTCGFNYAFLFSNPFIRNKILAYLH